jgi:hypothetical protein
MPNYNILKVDVAGYTSWLEKYSPADLEDDDKYDQASEEKEAIVTSLNDDLYPSELHNTVAQIADSITSCIDKSAGGRELRAFCDFARVIYWSQVDSVMPNELDIKSEHLELSLAATGLKQLERFLQEMDPSKIEAQCATSKALKAELDELSSIVDLGVQGLRDRWLSAVQQCLKEHRGLVVEVY